MANLLSYSRILLAILFVYLVSSARLHVAFVVMSIAAITDYLDGYVARKTNSVTAFGAILDPIADRIFVLCLCVALVIKYWQEPLFQLASALLAARELFVAIGFLWFKRKGIKIAVTRLGKVATAFVFIAFVVIFILPKLGIYLLLAAIAVYMVSALDYATKAWRQIA